MTGNPTPQTEHAGDYLIITGHGRSGSNRLLDVFDCHPDTFCRNEPNELPTASLSQLPGGFFVDDIGPDFLPAWRRAVSRTRLELSARDRIGHRRKSYVKTAAHRLLAREALSRKKVRQAISMAAPALKGEVWPTTLLYADPDLLQRAIPVFKLLLCQGWLLNAFPHERGMKVILNIRAPKPFLRSWRHRYVARSSPEFVFGQNLLTLDRILAHFGRVDACIGEFSEANLVKSELWRWRYINEPLFTAFSGDPRFKVVTYEAFDANPEQTAEALFTFASLNVDETVRRMTGELRNKLFTDKAPPYQHEALLDDAVADVLAGSPLLALWADVPSIDKNAARAQPAAGSGAGSGIASPSGLDERLS